MALKPAELHLENAARCLERILNRRDPQHVYTVSIGPRNIPGNTSEPEVIDAEVKGTR